MHQNCPNSKLGLHQKYVKTGFFKRIINVSRNKSLKTEVAKNAVHAWQYKLRDCRYLNLKDDGGI